MATSTLTAPRDDAARWPSALSTAEHAVIEAASATVDAPAEGRPGTVLADPVDREVQWPAAHLDRARTPTRFFRRAPFIAGVAALVTTLAFAAVTLSASDEVAPAASAPVAAAGPSGIGDVVSTSTFDFVVDDVDCGVTSIPTSDATLRPRDEYCLLALRATNTSGVDQPLFASTQYLRTSGGLEIAPDVVASLSATLAEAGAEGVDVAPGDTVARTLVFDVPLGADPTHLRLQGTTLTGATVSLAS